jgi:hypothetical protein
VEDEEAFYIAALLHDLGLTEEHFYRNPDVYCFAVEGALAANQFLVDEGWEQTRRDVVAEAITLHANMLVELSHGPLAHYLSAGAKCDVVGARASDIPHPAIEEVLHRYPGLGFGQVFGELLMAEARSRPESRTALIINNFPAGELFPFGQ